MPISAGFVLDPISTERRDCVPRLSPYPRASLRLLPNPDSTFAINSAACLASSPAYLESLAWYMKEEMTERRVWESRR